ncbi:MULTISPECIES: hypothetical protein [unclassified Pseudomonas]|uniref:hypothetical protein n=1 Tax=unclassified Pseudomonas TaxID=196821 RepID=UPI00257F69CC|nr:MULTISPECIES: hypothetical protein [unclassified Pseudomonas]
MQQRKVGATIFHLQVAPSRAFSAQVAFLLPFGAISGFFSRKTAAKVSFSPAEKGSRRVAPFTQKIRVAPGCTRIVLQILLTPA